ncbi:MAG TPA: hypothetical protein VMX97_10645, partial [Hyphomicrobiaceae bacterium]|nr:hypothetical protein [Hyphomicrobiaceae bacterium]
LQKQVEDNRTLAATKTVPIEAQVASFARPGREETYPKKVPATLLVMAAVLVLGLALLLAREIIMAGRRSPHMAAQPGFAPGAFMAGGRRESDRAVVPELETPQPNISARLGNRVADTLADTPKVLAAAETVSRVPSEPKSQVAAVAEPVREATGLAGEATLKGIAAHLNSRKSPDAGYRSLVAGERQGIDPTDEALTLAHELQQSGAHVIIVDWSLDGHGCAGDLDLPAEPGVAELLAGTATFEDVIVEIPDSEIHFIASGKPLDEVDASLDADTLNLVLDALDEAYDHIVVVGQFGPAQALFEAIQGRFDAGITIADSRRGRAVVQEPEDSFLGFEVTDIDVIRFERSRSSATSSRRTQIAEAGAV